MDKYWDDRLGKEYEEKYSWKTDRSRAVSFHTLVEFYVMMQFAEAGVKTVEVLKAHKQLSGFYKTAFPLANKEVVDNIKTDGNKIYLNTSVSTIILDGTEQLCFDLIRDFFLNLEFDSEQLASKLWPLGKEKSIVVDPLRSFGHPVINETNIYPDIINNHYKAGDPLKYIAYVYDLSDNQVNDAIEYCTAA